LSICVIDKSRPRRILSDAAQDRLSLPIQGRMSWTFTPLAEIFPLIVVSLNLRRRHLDESQRAMVAAKLATLQEGRPKLTASIEAVSQHDAASMLNVGRSSVQRGRDVLDGGVPELQQAVERGQVSVSAAADVAT